MKNKDIYSRTLPAEHNLESVLLGSCLNNKHCLEEFTGLIENSEVFDLPRHEAIAKAIIQVNHSGYEVEPFTVKDRLEKNGDLEISGGLEYLLEISGNFISPNMAQRHSLILLDLWKRRESILSLLETIDELYEGEKEPEELISSTILNLDKISTVNAENTLAHVSESVISVSQKIERLKNHTGDLTGVDTGLTELNSLTNGWQNTDLIILAARPAQGKTALALNIAYHAASSKFSKPVGVFIASLEMSKDQLTERLISSISAVKLENIRNGKLTELEMDKVVKASGLLSNMPIYIDDKAGLTINQIAARAKKVQKKKGIGLVVVDYLQLVKSMKGKGKNRNEEIADITEGLKRMAKDMNVPVIALSQMSRDVESRKGSDKEPRLSDLRDGGSIEQDADLVMFIFHKPGLNGKWENYLCIEKYRHGSAPQKKQVKFIGSIQRWVNYSDDAFKQYDSFQAATTGESKEDAPF